MDAEAGVYLASCRIFHYYRQVNKLFVVFAILPRRRFGASPVGRTAAPPAAVFQLIRNMTFLRTESLKLCTCVLQATEIVCENENEDFWRIMA